MILKEWNNQPIPGLTMRQETFPAAFLPQICLTSKQTRVLLSEAVIKIMKQMSAQNNMICSVI